MLFDFKKRRFNKWSKLLAIVTVLMISVALSGCSNNKPKSIDDVTEKDLEKELKKIEEQIAAESKTPETQAPEGEFTISSEIVNADFGSGLIQLNNEIFQQGGYLTVEEFVNKYSGSFDITYKGGSYEDNKGYLVEYTDGLSEYENNQYYLELAPKAGDPKDVLKAYVANFVSPDEKITLDKAIVISVEDKYKSPAVTPQGFGRVMPAYYSWDGTGSVNSNYDVNSFVEFLKSQGFVPIADMNAMGFNPTAEIKTYYFDKSNYIFVCYAPGTENLGGKKPIYKYSFIVSKDTDKISSAKYEVWLFVDEEKSKESLQALKDLGHIQ